MEEIIKKLEEKKKILEDEQHKIDLKIITLVGVINDLKEYDVDEPKPEKFRKKNKPKPEKTSSGSFSMSTEKKPSKKKGGGRRPAGKRMFTKDIDEFIKENWESNTDTILRELIYRKFDKSYSIEQIKGNRRNLGCSSNKIGRKKEQKVLKKIERVERVERVEKPLKARKNKYPDEMIDFVKENIESNPNPQLVDLVNKEYNLKITIPKLAAWMSYKKIKRESRSKKYTEQVMEFLKENIDNFSNREICKELHMRFDIEIKVGNLSQFLSKKGIKRDYQLDVDQEIIDFIKNSKTKDAHVLRDDIIEKFEKNLPMDKIRSFMKKGFPGEGVKDEVKRIKEKIEEEDIGDDSIDEMDLG